jgi:hypothetical protein
MRRRHALHALNAKSGAAPQVTERDQFRRIRAARSTIALCALLLLTFITLAGFAVAGKSPTFDEPCHALAGWLHLWKGEYHYDSENPPLWDMLAAIATRPGDIQIDENRLGQIHLPMDSGQAKWWHIHTLFQTRGNDGVALVARCRPVMLALGAMIGLLLAIWVWRLSHAAGASVTAAAAATIFSTGLFAFDPNFLANAPLVKNDVSSALAMLGLVYCTWGSGRELTTRRMVMLGLWSGAAVMVKFNAPLLIASSLALLLLRALLPWPWPTRFWRASQVSSSRIQRVGVAVATILAMGLFTFAIIWMGYRMRFSPSPQRGTMMDIAGVVSASIDRQWQAQSRDTSVAATTQQLATLPKPIIVRLCVWANDHRLLPQPFLAGFLYAFQASQVRATFLCGQSSDFGTWWYFPLAMAAKTPVATIVTATIMSAFWIFRHKFRPSFTDASAAQVTAPEPTLDTSGVWTALCLFLPVAIYLGAAMWSGINVGLRHILPVYPLLYAAAGLGMAKLWDSRPASALAIGIALLTGLAIESCCAYPNYLPFFNALAGGSRGGLGLLSDSNLDWGQDLPLLAAWQESHPDQKLYLAYFGTVDPAVYGIRYTNVADGYVLGPPPQPIESTGVLAISATTLQGPYCDRVDGMPTWSMLWKLKPFEVLGGSIYLFHVPPSRADLLPMGQSLVK